jgi:hypothetical protein
MFFDNRKKLTTLFWMAIGAGILTSFYSLVLFRYVYKINKNVTKSLKSR